MSETTRRRALPPELSVLRRRTQQQTEWLSIDGVRLRCAIRRGRGRPIVLLNGAGAALESLAPLVGALDEHELIVPEMPGCGPSPTLKVPRPMSWYAGLLARLLDRLGYDSPVNLVGLGWGGLLAQAFALRFAARTNRLVLAASSVGAVARPLSNGAMRRFRTLRRYRRAELTAEGLSRLYGGFIRQHPELITREAEPAPGPSARGYVYQLMAGTGWTSLLRLHTLACPTLVMGGDDDPVSPLVNSRLLYWLIPKSHLHVMRGGGHLFLLLRANESAAVILRFINERRYDGTDNADYFTARGLRADGRLLPEPPAADGATS